MTRCPRRFPPLRPLAAAVLALACGSGASPAGEDGADKPAALPEPAGELACRRLPDADGREVADLFPAGEGAFGALYARDRIVEIRGTDPADRRTVVLDRQGPLGVVDPAGAALLDDSLLAVADRPRGRIKLVTVDGADAGFVDLGFPPQAVVAAGGRLFASPFVLTPDRRELLHRVEPGPPGPPVRPAGVAPLASDDPGWTALGNMVALAAAPDGSLLLAHRLARARAFVLPPGGGAARPLRLAMDGREASRLGVRPPTPFGEEALDRIAVPVVDAAGGPGPGAFAYLTRSGERPADGTPPKLLVRLEADGTVRAVHRVPVDARLVVGAPGGGWVIADADGLWRCEGPRDPA